MTIRQALRSVRWRGRRAQRGLSLIEVLVAFFILFVVTLAVLQMFSMAYLVSQTAEMRTELTYKAQQVIEQVRIQAATEVTHACCPLTMGTTFHITDKSNATCFNGYWGSGGANIVEPDARYELRYNVTAGTTGGTLLTVEAVPTTQTGFRYLGDLGGTTAGRAVRYAAEI